MTTDPLRTAVTAILAALDGMADRDDSGAIVPWAGYLGPVDDTDHGAALDAAIADARAALAQQAASAANGGAVAHVSECEACFTPVVCQLRGTCDHYAAGRLRVAREPDALTKWGDWTMLPHNATEPMQKAMQRAVLMRKSMNDVWRAAISEAPQAPKGSK